MKNNKWIFTWILTITVVVVGMLSVSANTYHEESHHDEPSICNEFIDNNHDGICDNHETHKCVHESHHEETISSTNKTSVVSNTASNNTTKKTSKKTSTKKTSTKKVSTHHEESHHNSHRSTHH